MVVVLDTNVLASAMMSRTGFPGQVLEAWRSDRYVLTMSNEVLRELTDVLHRPHIRERIHMDDEALGEMVANLGTGCLWFEEVPDVEPLEADPRDTKFLALAIAAGQM